MDWFLLDGQNALFAVALALLLVFEQDILAIPRGCVEQQLPFLLNPPLTQVTAALLLDTAYAIDIVPLMEAARIKLKGVLVVGRLLTLLQSKKQPTNIPDKERSRHRTAPVLNHHC